MKLDSKWLANIFIKQREIIEAAETPFAKLAVFILPILAPAVPAFMTGFHIYQLFIEIFSFAYKDEASLGMAAVIAITLELLGYVGAISFIRSIFDWIRTKEDEHLLPMLLNGAAYIFYLVAMYLINVSLGKYFNTVFGLLSFITVPSSLLAANHLNELREDEENSKLSDRELQEKIRQESRLDKLELEKLRIKSQYKKSRHSQSRRESHSQSQPRIISPKISSQSPSLNNARMGIYAEMDKAYKSKKTILAPADLVDMGFEKSAVTRYRSAWLDDHPETKKFAF